MKITRNVVTITDLHQWLNEGTLMINKKYQRSAGLWPKNARSYFIDTILNDFTFPKITIRQTIDLKTRKSIREVVDGQQRLTTISDFINGKLILTTVSKLFTGKSFDDLDREIQENFLAYEVSVDTIITGTNEEVLEIFRRINSYTVPLNFPEKRHASYQGEFKWFLVDLVEKYSPLLEGYEILSLRSIARMEDADLFTELTQIIMKGILARNSSALEKLYKENDAVFSQRAAIYRQICDTIDYIKNNIVATLDSGMITGYLLYSLFAALTYNKYGIVGLNSSDMDGMNVIGTFANDDNVAEQNILELLQLLEEKEENSNNEFVKACSSSTQSINNRLIRTRWFVKALQNDTYGHDR